MASIHYPGGAVVAIVEPITLEVLQQAVGGFIEAVELPDGRLMMVNEEGKLEGLPINWEATNLARIPNDIIVGPVVIGTHEELSGNDEEES